jgi:N-methylhydantoinase A
MDLLAMKACIVPPNPGNLSAFGLLAVDWRTDHIVTKVMHEDAIDLSEIAARYAALERDATATLMRDGIEASRIRLIREADIRYAGQSMEVRVTAPGGIIDTSFLTGLIGAFNAAHLKTFGYNYAGKQKIELVNLCVSGFGVIERPQMPKLTARTAHFGPKSARPVYFGAQYEDTPVYDRASLPSGGRVNGPAVIEEFGSTTVVFPSQYLLVDPHGILVVRPMSSPETSR